MVSGIPMICLIKWASGRQNHAVIVTGHAREPQTTPEAAVATNNKATITIGLTSPPNAKLSTADIIIPNASPMAASACHLI